MQISDIKDFNIIIKFLALRHLNELTQDNLFERYQIEQVDLIILLGNSIPNITKLVAEAYKNGLAKEIMIAGGIGHATQYLVQNIVTEGKYKDIATHERPEADILNQILVKHENIGQGKIILENTSTNCGSNAKEALKVLKEKGKAPESILLVQDPTMQLRSYASFLKEWENEKAVIISYAPFIPQLELSESIFEFAKMDIKGLWDENRYIDLIMGEIPRLKDDTNGYGPKGKGYLTHVHVPQEVMDAYLRLLRNYSEYDQIRYRKGQ